MCVTIFPKFYNENAVILENKNVIKVFVDSLIDRQFHRTVMSCILYLVLNAIDAFIICGFIKLHRIKEPVEMLSFHELDRPYILQDHA